MSEYQEMQKKLANFYSSWSKEGQLRYKNKYPEKVKKINKNNVDNWRKKHPEKFRKIYLRYVYKRERNLGYIPLNDYHKGDEFHHIDKTYGIYIPKEVHKSVSHNVYTNKNMDEINAIAWNYI